MNTTLKVSAIAFLALLAPFAHADVEITARLIEASPDVTVTADLTHLSQVKGVDLLAAPRVTVKSGKTAKIAVTRDFDVEGQDAIPVGVELVITAEQIESEIIYVARYTLTEFKGFSDADKKQRPVFQTTIIPFNGSAQDNVPILIEAGNESDPNVRRYIHLTIKNV